MPLSEKTRQALDKLTPERQEKVRRMVAQRLTIDRLKATQQVSNSKAKPSKPYPDTLPPAQDGTQRHEDRNERRATPVLATLNVRAAACVKPDSAENRHSHAASALPVEQSAAVAGQR